MRATRPLWRMLLADDEPGTRNLLASILRSETYGEIVHAGDGQHALNLLRQAPGFDIAFLDIDMPGLTGIEVMRQCAPLLPQCRWVIVTANSALENVMAALNGGADGFVVKPYNMKKIQDILAKFSREDSP
jgi:CheY-like chemotaxis protein